MYTDKKSLEFTINLTANTYTNYSSMEIVLPIWFVKNTDKTAQLAGTLMPVNNYFVRWFTEIDIKRYPDDMKTLPTDKTMSIYDYANSQLKYLPPKSVKDLLKSFLYSNRNVYLDEETDRRDNTNGTAAKRSDPNLTYRIAQLADFIFEKNEYRIPLGLLCDLGLCNFPVQTNTRIIITLEKNLNKLFEDNAKVDNIPANPDASIEFHDRPYIEYQEILLTSLWETFLKTIQRPETAMRMGVLPNPFQQTYEIKTGAQTQTVDFTGVSCQFDWLEISLVYDNSYQHETVYDSYDLELAAHLIQSVKFQNASKAYTLTGKISYDIDNKDEKYRMYKIFVAYQCNGCTFAPLTQYKNNEVYQNLTNEYDYRG